MTYRSIFVHVDDSDQTDLRLDAATRLARHYPAEVAGAYIVSTRDFTPTESALLPPDLVKARMGAVAQAQRDAEKRFRAAVAAAGVKSLQWRAPAGDPLEAAVLQARYSISRSSASRHKRPAAFSAGLRTRRDGLEPAGADDPTSARRRRGRASVPGRTPRVGARSRRCAAVRDAKAVLAIAVSPRGDQSQDTCPVRRSASRRWTRPLTDGRTDIASGEFLLARGGLRADMIVMGGYSPRLSLRVGRRRT
jgi:nucleotide-binding universal stress UspA family protein